jgi:hypothetical protein
VSVDDEKAQAARLFYKFHGVEPRESDILAVEIVGEKICLVVGYAVGILYQSLGGELFDHRFKESARPLLVVTSDGTQTFMLKGAYRFTDRGFLD